MKQNKEEQRKRLLRQYHTLASRCGMSADDKRAILCSYGVDSSTQLTIAQLVSVCDFLQNKTTGKAPELDKLRKMCLCAGCSWIVATNEMIRDKIEYTKQMACRIGGKSDFNKLTASELRTVIYWFNKRRKGIERGNEMIERENIMITKTIAKA